ncbi:hypothetical protein E4L96_19875 [Massilia arenosa]|uniref:Uncharacterized protein n=1 Tax=Zemynaea arenosa TaxID=2561931 RepID=A0A4Y9S1C9_9BURK|nr:hypothetical protein [Massilia arenosa]TFW13358.1 hypothetical protein E4L96_19875 [Massilia arenosa]
MTSLTILTAAGSRSLEPPAAAIPPDLIWTVLGCGVGSIAALLVGLKVLAYIHNKKRSATPFGKKRGQGR